MTGTRFSWIRVSSAEMRVLTYPPPSGANDERDGSAGLVLLRDVHPHVALVRDYPVLLLGDPRVDFGVLGIHDELLDGAAWHVGLDSQFRGVLVGGADDEVAVGELIALLLGRLRLRLVSRCGEGQ
jgi:hypothetical protein